MIVSVHKLWTNVPDFMPLTLKSSSLTCFDFTVAAIILQLVAMECGKLHMVDSPVQLCFSRKFPGINVYKYCAYKAIKEKKMLKGFVLQKQNARHENKDGPNSRYQQMVILVPRGSLPYWVIVGICGQNG